MNAQNAIKLIIVNNNLMEIIMENAYVKMDILTIIKIIYVKSVLSFGEKIFIILNF